MNNIIIDNKKNLSLINNKNEMFQNMKELCIYIDFLATMTYILSKHLNY